MDVMKTTQSRLDARTYESTEQFIRMITTSDTSKSCMIKDIETSEAVGITPLDKNRHAFSGRAVRLYEHTGFITERRRYETDRGTTTFSWPFFKPIT
ncbi:hypothetical protein GLW04_01850 [Halobacillus litoralis]|uniref:Uncharacterized protein n=2 Tax=Halobacillus litoralis TaxID=45668 RepID=A0A845DQF7_9BACI|nr:hypothetical protein [Halobacillus litoralis]